MKKVLLSLAVIAAIFTGVQSMSAKSVTALGLEYNWNGVASGFGITAKFGNFPVIDVSFFLGNTVHIGALVDWWIANDRLIGALNYYLGVGGFGGIFVGNNTFSFELGGRLPVVGLQLFVIPNLELFAEAALGIDLISQAGIGINFWPQVGAGFRVHF